MEYGIVSVPAAPVRRKPNHRREMVNQLLFGETVQVIKEKGGLWVKVRSIHDDYEGWMTRTLLNDISKQQAYLEPEYLASGLLNTIMIQSQRTLLPIGATLPVFDNGKGKCGNKTFEYNGEYRRRKSEPASGAFIEALSREWLNAPYLWGGRTILGVDCSGFVQVNFKLMGYDLPRDAWQQAQAGEPVKKLRDALKGDLAFFDDKDEIVHVGILLGADTIIHASGKVRIDSIDKKGIIHSETGKRTHSLKAIRRLF